MATPTGSTVKAETWLDSTQIEQLRNACYDDAFATYLQQRNEAMVVLLKDTGLLVSEMINLNVDHLLLDQRKIRVPKLVRQRSEEETESETQIEISDDTFRVLKGYLNHRWKSPEALFPSRKSDRVSQQGVRHMLKKAADIAGIEPWKYNGERGQSTEVTPQVVRHSMARQMLQESTASLDEVRQRLRHQSIHTTERLYGHFQ